MNTVIRLITEKQIRETIEALLRLSEIESILGHVEDAKHYTQLAADLKQHLDLRGAL